MLVLTRKIGESIVINDDITIMILGTKRLHGSNISSQVRLGIEAPKNVTVHREEVFEKIYGKDNLPLKDNYIKMKLEYNELINMASKLKENIDCIEGK